MCKPAAVSILWKTRSRLLNLQTELNKLILTNNRSITLTRITKHRTKEFRFVKLQKKKQQQQQLHLKVHGLTEFFGLLLDLTIRKY